MNIVEKMKTDWDRRAVHDARYWIATEDYRSDEVFDRSGETTAEAILTLVGGENGELDGFRVLDIGCGIGRVLKPMAARIGELVGIDVSPEMVAQSKVWLAGLSNVTTRVGSGVDLDGLEDQSFDLVYSYVAFQHMPHQVFNRYLRESHRVLRDDGWLVFQVYLGSRPDPKLGDTISLRVYGETDLTTRLGKSGFHIEQRRLEHRTQEGLESWLILASRAGVGTGTRNETSWTTESCGEVRSPMDEHLYRNLARKQIAEGAETQAIETMRRHLEFDSGALTVALELAALLVQQGRIDEAIVVLETITGSHSDYPEAYLTLAQLLVLVGRRSEALATIDRLRAGFVDDHDVQRRARHLLASSRLDTPREEPGL